MLFSKTRPDHFRQNTGSNGLSNGILNWIWALAPSHKNLLLALVAIALLAPLAASGQVSSATISGQVKDSTGAAIPGVKVTALELATGSDTTVQSDESGQYTLPFLAPGPYNIVAEGSGFKRFETKNLVLSVGDHPTIDITMVAGGTQETVEVTATAPLLGTSDAALGNVVTSKQVESLPLNGRTPMVLAQYTAGVVSTTNPGKVRAYDNSAVSAFSVGGLANKNSEILLDGAPDNASDNAIAYSPMQDAVSEVRVHVFESDAAYGHAGGGVANQTSKSGSNSFHGSAWEFNQSAALNANTYFGSRGHKPKINSHFNQYGGTIGGPIRIPKLFNGKDKLFWFFGFEGIKDITPNNVLTSVPTDAERNGDFSALLALSSSYQIYNPYSATQNGSKVTRNKIAGNNLVNAGLTLNPVAQALLKLYPSPNYATTTVDQNNYFAQNPSTDDFTNEFARVDWQVSSRQRVFFTYRHNDRLQKVSSIFGNNDPALGDRLTRINNGATIDDVYTFTPTLIGEMRLNYTRYEQTQDTTGAGYNSTNLGLPSALNSSSGSPRLPYFKFANYQSVGNSLVSGTMGPAPFNSYGVYANLVKILGAHTLKVGTDLRRFQKGGTKIATCADNSGSNVVCSNGFFYFDSSWTRADNQSNTSSAGQDMAAFLLGLPTQASYAIATPALGANNYMSFFFQDDWRVRSDLTLNLGIRYDQDFSAYERQGRALNGFDMTTPNPIASAAQTAYAANPLSILPASSFQVNGGPTFASTSDKNIYNNQSHMFSPRFGFAWTPDKLGKNTVVRGGFGLFVLPVYPFNSAINNSGYSQTTSSTVTSNNYYSPNITLSNPFPNGFLQPSGSSNGLKTNLGSAVTYFAPEVRNGYAERWNLGIQHQFGDYLFEVVYIGNSGLRLPINYSPNYIPRSFLTTASNTSLNGSVTNPFKGLIPNSSSMNGSTIKESQLLMRFPEFGTLTEQNAPLGGSNYHAVDVRLEKRPGKGITIIANYQFSKLLEHVSYLNYFDAPEYRLSSYDHAHHTVLGVTYELPFGRGRMFGSNISRLLDLPLGGWTINGVYSYQTGAPITWGDATYDGSGFRFNPRKTVGLSFNTAAFSNVVPVNHIRTFGSQYSNFKYDAINNFDSSVMKDFKFSEKAYFQLRAEAFNTFNRAQFSAPNINPANTSTFGTITGTANSPRVVQVGGRIVF